jgi:DNA helicase-2/ATP-dependent DNA helicase PcrA
MAAPAPKKKSFSFLEDDSASNKDNSFGRSESSLNFDKPEPGSYKQSQASYKPFITPATKQFEGSKMSNLDYGVGDSVKHIKFGVGIVTNINAGGKTMK